MLSQLGIHENPALLVLGVRANHRTVSRRQRRTLSRALEDYYDLHPKIIPRNLKKRIYFHSLVHSRLLAFARCFFPRVLLWSSFFCWAELFSEQQFRGAPVHNFENESWVHFIHHAVRSFWGKGGVPTQI